MFLYTDAAETIHTDTCQSATMGMGRTITCPPCSLRVLPFLEMGMPRYFCQPLSMDALSVGLPPGPCWVECSLECPGLWAQPHPGMWGYMLAVQTQSLNIKILEFPSAAISESWQVLHMSAQLLRFKGWACLGLLGEEREEGCVLVWFLLTHYDLQKGMHAFQRH